jgi:hypothetical protein
MQLVLSPTWITREATILFGGEPTMTYPDLWPFFDDMVPQTGGSKRKKLKQQKTKNCKLTFGLGNLQLQNVFNSKS